MSNAIKSAASPRAQRWDETEAAAALRACERSGLTIEAYARQEGYSGQRLRNWKRRLGRELATAPVKFAPVRITGAAVMPRHMATREVSIDVGSVTVRVREDLDVEHIARIVGALGRVARGC